MHPSGRTSQEEVEEAHTRAEAAAARQALVIRTQRRGPPGVGHSSDMVEDWVARHNLRVVGVGRMVGGEGQHRADRHRELAMEEGRTRTAERVVVQVDSLIGHTGLEVGAHRKEHLDPGSRS